MENRFCTCPVRPEAESFGESTAAAPNRYSPKYPPDPMRGNAAGYTAATGAASNPANSRTLPRTAQRQTPTADVNGNGKYAP